MMPPTATFDALAGDYDRSFTHSVVGRAQRRVVTTRMLRRFQTGDRVLELGCGTGADALALARHGVHVLATDPSPGMLEVARAKAARDGLAGTVRFHQLAAEQLTDLETSADADDRAPFDGVLSNFGALNMASDLPAVASRLAERVRPGGVAMLCFLGRRVPWEWLWFGLRLAPRAAFRRLRSGGARWRDTVVRYPSVRELRRVFEPEWKVLRIAGVGIFVPPSYTESWAAKHPTLIDRLARIDRAIETTPPFTGLGDHVLLELERR